MVDAGANKIEQLWAIEQIKQLKARYCRHADNKDWVNWVEVFTDDAQLDIRLAMHVALPDENSEGRDKYGRVHVGKAAIIDWINSSERIVISSSHHCHFPEIEILSPTTASGIWALEDRLIFKDGFANKQLLAFGYYHETYRKEGNVWLIESVRLSRLRVELAARLPGEYEIAIAELANTYPVPA